MNAAALLAQRAYGSTNAIGAGLALTGPQTASQSPISGFSQILAEQVSTTLESGRAAEAQATQAVMGQGELVDVVTALSAAEVQMETMVSFRDAAISAYQEIMRMPI